MSQHIEFTDEEIKEDLWAWNDFQDRLLENDEKQIQDTKEQA